MEIIKKFKSKRNEVYLIQRNDNVMIYKKLFSLNNLKKEVDCITNLQHIINVPKIIKIEKDILYLEYINGLNLSDYLHSLEMQNVNDCCNVINIIRDYLVSLYNTSYFTENNYILNDINLRNFIIFDNRIYGIDFEEIREGIIEEDIAGFISFVLTNNPSFSVWKYNFVSLFYKKMSEKLDLDEEKIMYHIYSWIDALEERRKCIYNNKNKVLKKINKQIKIL